MNTEQPSIFCHECEAEFTVVSSYDDPIDFCPHCGSEIEYEDEDDDLDEYFEELDDSNQ